MAMRDIFLAIYRFICARQWAYRWNMALYKLSLRGMGVLNSEGPVVTGEAWLLSTLSKKKIPLKTVIDVGANTGEFSTQVVQFFPSARVLAYEPHPATYTLLCKEVASLPNIEIYNMGMSYTAGKAQLWDFASDAQLKHTQPTSTLATLHKKVIGSLYHQKSASVAVKLTTLDVVATQHHIKYIDFLKIDTEGHELAVLQGAKKLVASGKVGIVQFEFNEMNVYSRVFLLDFIELLPYHRFYRLLPQGLLSLQEYRPLTHEIMAFQNIVALPDGVQI